MVVVVGDQHLGLVGRQAARIDELPGGRSSAAPGERFAPVECEALDAVVARVGDVDVFPADRDAAAGRLRRVLGGAEVKPADFGAPMPPREQEVAVGVELLDAIVAGVDHVDVAGAIDREASDRPELAVPAAIGAPLRFKDTGRAEALHDVAELIGDVDVALRPERHRLGEAQHALATLPGDRDRGVGAGLRARARAPVGAGRLAAEHSGRRAGEQRREQQGARVLAQAGAVHRDRNTRAPPAERC